MPKSSVKTKRLTATGNESREPEKKDQHALDLFTEAEKQKKVSSVTHREERTIDSSIGTSKLKKVDLIQVSQDKMKKQHLPVPKGWNVTDGDYNSETSKNDDVVLRLRSEKKRLQFIYFALALALVALIVVAFASLASKAFSL